MRNHYRQMRVDVKKNDGRRLAIVFRVYDDGLGFRYEFPKLPNNRATHIADELTEFTFAADGTAWWKPAFEWNREDVLKVIASNFEPGVPFKWIDFPQPNYASSSADMVMHGDKMVGMSMFNGYSYNERTMLSLGVVAQDVQDLVVGQACKVRAHIEAVTDQLGQGAAEQLPGGQA